jgi:signal transduction histidine kinase
MRFLQRLRARPTWIAVMAVAGLLLVLMVTGGVGIIINQRVNSVAHHALIYDVRLEDHGDDLRAAVLDLRHYHRNILFAGPSRGGLTDFEAAYQQLLREIGDLEQLASTDPDVLPPVELRTMAERYYAELRPAIDLYDTDRQAFIAASDQGLIQIDDMDRAAVIIDRLGEERAEAALTDVERSSRTATLNLIAVLAGLALIGAVLAYLVIQTVNDMRQLYAEQQATAAQLAEALQSKNHFIADASHELRTPLTVLRGSAEVGLELERDCVHAPILEDIVKESARMTRLVEDLLFLARSDSDSLPLEIARVPAISLVTGLVEPAEMLVREYGSTLVTALDGAGELAVDVARIEQAVLILIDNAAKYGADGTPVSLTSSTRHGELMISVRDQGPGIPEADLPLIFERFYRVDKTRARKLGGAGLGLAIAKSVVEAHSGRIEARSKPNDGTTMTLYLPLASAASPQSQAPAIVSEVS